MVLTLRRFRVHRSIRKHRDRRCDLILHRRMLRDGRGPAAGGQQMRLPLGPDGPGGRRRGWAHSCQGRETGGRGMHRRPPLRRCVPESDMVRRTGPGGVPGPPRAARVAGPQRHGSGRRAGRHGPEGGTREGRPLRQAGLPGREREGVRGVPVPRIRPDGRRHDHLRGHRRPDEVPSLRDGAPRGRISI